MNGYEMLGIAVANGIIYFLCSAILGLIICCIFCIFTMDDINGADLDNFPACAWIGGCIVCVVMVLRCIY